jgi:uncharacterized protein (DUF3820 family)
LNEPIVCKRCDSTKYKTVPSGPHIKAVCAKCDSYIKFLPQPIDAKSPEEAMPFGKYKGMTFLAIQERDHGYLQWLMGSDLGRPARIARLLLTGEMT